MIRINKPQSVKTCFGFSKIKYADLFFVSIIILSNILIPNLHGKPAVESIWAAPQTANKLNNPVKSSQQTIDEAKTLYSKNCSSCHGKKGKGDGPKSGDLEKVPGNFTSADFAKQSDGAIFWKITEGRKPMPSFKNELTVQQRWLLVTYIRTLRKALAK